MKNKRILLKNAIDFHGHLGPYLVLGLLMGNSIINRFKLKKHFGIEAIVKGALNKPKSCLIDGLQLSTGCTYGKGNIHKIKGSRIEVLFKNRQSNKRIKALLKEDLIKKLENLNGHKDSEIFAERLLKAEPEDLFDIKVLNF